MILYEECNMKNALTYEYEDLVVSVTQQHRNRDRLQQEILI